MSETASLRRFFTDDELQMVDGMPEGGRIHQLSGVASAFTPDYAPEEMFEIATKLYQASR